MKICLISASRIPSTTANSMQVMKTAQAATQMGHQVLLIVPGEQLAPFESLVQHYGLQTSFEVEWQRAPRTLRRYDLAWKGLHRARAWGANLIYTWMPQAAVLALWQGYPTLLEIHDMPSGTLGPLVFRLFWWAKGKKRLLSITRALLARLEETYALKYGPGETAITPNGVDLERYADLPDPAAARAALGLPEAFTAAYSGHFYPGRGMDLLCGLAQKNPEIQFLWTGGNPEAVALWRARLQQAGATNVILTGFLPNQELPRYQAAAEILLMPYERAISGSSGGDSAAIASPMKMFEYLACGRAIISSDLPVIHEVLNDGNACFCPPEDLEAWHQALIHLQADADLRSHLGRQASLDANEYSWLRREQKALAGF